MHGNEVFVSITLGSETIRIGTFYFHQHRNLQTVSFSYDKQWLSHPERFAIDPALQLTFGSFHTAEQQQLFGTIGDSAPDR